MAATHLHLGMRCIKYLLCAVNSLFVLTGAMILSVGTTIYAVYNDFSHFLDSSYFSPASLLIGVGALIFMIALCGCYGALKESTCIVLVFAASLSVVLVLEFCAAVASYALQDSIIELLDKKINYTMHAYETSEDARIAVDFLQSNLHCCGYNGPSDWRGILSQLDQVEVPPSCCHQPHFGYYVNPVYESQECAQFYQAGCYHHLVLLVNRTALYLIAGAMMIGIIQVAGIMFAFTLGQAIRRQKTERERRRWQLRESLLSGYEPLGKNDPFSAFPVVYMTNDANFKDAPTVN